MSLPISIVELNKTIKFINDQNQRNLAQTLTSVKNIEHAHYQKYALCRALLYQTYRESSARLVGIRFLLIEHKHATDKLKQAEKDLHADWQLYDFNIVALQRPGTKPPYHFEKAA
jgi:hypothetical protein